jgi:hypothetical protein
MRPHAALQAALYPRIDLMFGNATNSANGLENFAVLCESGAIIGFCIIRFAR